MSVSPLPWLFCIALILHQSTEPFHIRRSRYMKRNLKIGCYDEYTSDLAVMQGPGIFTRGFTCVLLKKPSLFLWCGRKVSFTESRLRLNPLSQWIATYPIYQKLYRPYLQFNKRLTNEIFQFQCFSQIMVLPIVRAISIYCWCPIP